MQRYIRVTISVFCLLLVLSPAGRADILSDNLEQAMERLAVQRGATSLCVLTNAGYVQIGGESTVTAIDTIQEITGCTSGSGRLLFFHRSTDNPLQVALFDRTAYRCVLITRNAGNTSLSDVVDIGLSRLENEQTWLDIQAALGSDASTIVTFAHHWAAGAPYDFMKCAEFHNHLCPGVTSGYFISKYIQQNLMSQGASCTFIACPCWCKDDAIQVLLDLTAGKKGIVVKNLTDEQLSHVRDENVAGIALITPATGEDTTAFVLAYEWDTADRLAGSDRNAGMASRIRGITGLIPYYQEPERLVTILDSQLVNAEQMEQLLSADNNPYETLGYTK